MVKVDIPQRSGLTIFVRYFQALVIPASCFAKGYLVVREAVERIECVQMSLNYLLVGSVMMCHMQDESGRNSSRNQ